MKKLLNKIRKNILAFTFVTLLVFILVTLLLNLVFSATFRIWVYQVMAILFLVGLILGLVQIIKNNTSKIQKVVIIIVIVFIVLILCLIGPLLAFFAAAILGKPEHVIYKDNKKYVAEVNSFLQVNVYYYDYINPFLRGNEIKIHENYGKGGYDAFDGEH